MRIAFFEAKDYDHIWFGGTAGQYGFEVCYIQEKFSKESLLSIEACDIICVTERNGFMTDEIRIMKYKGIKGIIILVEDETGAGRWGVLREIPVITVPRFSPREAVSK